LPLVIPQTATQDTYVNALTFGGQSPIAQGVINIANATVFARLVTGVQGQAKQSNDIQIAPALGIPLAAGVRDSILGLQFRSAVAGTPAQVWGVLYYPGEATLLGGQQFSGTVANNGSVTPVTSSVLTGQIAAAGTVTAGTGFTVSAHPSAGIYTISFTTAFAATPTVVTSIFDSGAGLHHAMDITAQSAAAFSVKITDNVGTPVDTAWNFLAQTTA
jgi:hypothetical protein